MSGFVVLPIDPFAATVKYTMPTRKTRERFKRLYTFSEAKDILGRLHGTLLEAPWDLMEMLMGHSLPGVSGRHYIRPSREQVARSVCDALGINWDISQQTSR